MNATVYNVPFLRTGNSARSILAEAIINREAPGKFKGYSAGSPPEGEVHPYTLDLPPGSVGKLSLQRHLDEIGKSRD